MEGGRAQDPLNTPPHTHVNENFPSVVDIYSKEAFLHQFSDQITAIKVYN